MSWPSGTFTPEDLFLFSDDNSNQAQEISQIGEQIVVKETVGLDLDKSSNKKQKKLRSDVWKNFEKYKDENGKDLAKCNICEKLFNGSSKMGTTHLKNHFKSCSKNKSNVWWIHPTRKPDGVNQQNKSNEGGGSAGGDKPAENSVMDQQLNCIETADIINVYNEEKEKLRIYFEKLPCRLSLRIDTELVRSGRYVYFSVHFIDDDWKLKEKIISWKCIRGDPIMKILKNVLSEWGIDNNISYMILDHDSYDVVMSSNERENWFSSQGSLLFNGKLFCICDYNYICLICIVSYVRIKRFLYDRMKEIFKYIKGNEDFGIAIDRAKSLGKKVTTGVIPTEQDLENMDYTARARVVDLHENALGLKEAFFELEKMDIEFKSRNLTKEEWDLIKTFCDLQDETEDQDCYNYKTANMYFPWLCSQYMIYLELVKLKPFIDEKESFHSMKDGMKCWYDDNLVLAVAAVLDPRFKMDIVKHWYKKIYGEECETRLAKFMEYLTSVYNEYAKGTNNYQSLASGSKEKKSTISYEMLDPLGKPRKVSHHHLDHLRSPNIELCLYLEDVKFPLIKDFNILDWWRINTQYFPTLGRMARDFLSIQITIPMGHLNGIQELCNDFDSDMVQEAALCVAHWL